jgi:hypothetical protein
MPQEAAVGHVVGEHGLGHGGEGDHGANHGAGHGADHQHAHLPEEHHGSTGRERAKQIATGIITIFCALSLLAIAGWAVNRIWSINRIEEEIAHLRAASEAKTDKSDVTNLRERLDGKAEKTDVTNVREKLDDKADAVPVKNLLDSDNAEIEKLRQLVANHNASYNNAIGKYDTVLNKHEADVVGLKPKTDSLCEKATKLEVEEANSSADLKQMRDVKIEKLTAEVAALRERIASLEANQKSLEART